MMNAYTVRATIAGRSYDFEVVAETIKQAEERFLQDLEWHCRQKGIHAPLRDNVRIERTFNVSSA